MPESTPAEKPDGAGPEWEGPYLLMFDCESIGLHGECFAVGIVVTAPDGREVESRCFACPPHQAEGHAEGRKWVDANVPPIEVNCEDPAMVRTRFWSVMQKWKARGAIIATACGWPVEANFLSACVRDDPARDWDGPYPLHDLASILLLGGNAPLSEGMRLNSEMPPHHPLADARHSARVMGDALRARSHP